VLNKYSNQFKLNQSKLNHDKSYNNKKYEMRRTHSMNGAKRNAPRISEGKQEGKTLSTSISCRKEVNVTIVVRETGCGSIAVWGRGGNYEHGNESPC
jgi:hypothetical protein